MADGNPAERTSRVAVYPSATLRPPPSFLFDVPKGWRIDETPSVLAFLRTEEEVDGFWPNVVVTSDRVPRGLSLRDAGIATFAKFEEQNPGLHVRTERLGNLGNRMTYMRSVDVTSPEGRQLSQMHALFFAPPSPDSRTADLFQMVGTCTTATIDQVGAQIVGVIGSFRFT